MIILSKDTWSKSNALLLFIASVMISVASFSLCQNNLLGDDLQCLQCHQSQVGTMSLRISSEKKKIFSGDSPLWLHNSSIYFCGFAFMATSTVAYASNPKSWCLDLTTVCEYPPLVKWLLKLQPPNEEFPQLL